MTFSCEGSDGTQSPQQLFSLSSVLEKKLATYKEYVSGNTGCIYMV